MADSDPLPSWNEGSTKRSILNFVRGVTTADGPQFVNPEERIAVFDNDGTLWSEQPFYFQFAFVLDRMKAMAHHPHGSVVGSGIWQMISLVCHWPVSGLLPEL
jgi:hypothetical protein